MNVFIMTSFIYNQLWNNVNCDFKWYLDKTETINKTYVNNIVFKTMFARLYSYIVIVTYIVLQISIVLF